MSSTKIGEVNGVMVHFPGHQSLEKLLSKLSTPQNSSIEKFSPWLEHRCNSVMVQGYCFFFTVPYHCASWWQRRWCWWQQEKQQIRWEPLLSLVFRRRTCLPATIDHVRCPNPWNEWVNDCNKQNNQPERKHIQAHQIIQDCQPRQGQDQSPRPTNRPTDGSRCTTTTTMTTSKTITFTLSLFLGAVHVSTTIDCSYFWKLRTKQWRKHKKTKKCMLLQNIQAHAGATCLLCQQQQSTSFCLWAHMHSLLLELHWKVI